MMKMFVILLCSLSASSTYSSDLNYLKLNVLRTQHSINSHLGGSSHILANSSKRFMDLLDSLQTEEMSEINESIDDSFNTPYKAQVGIFQSVLIDDLLVEFSAQNSLVVEINNPVFPELELFNVRSDTLSIQKKIKLFETIFSIKLSLMNRWYIDNIFSLEEIITENVDMNLNNGDTFVPVYLDFRGIYETVDYRLIFEGVGFELTNVDDLDYYEFNTAFLKNVYKGVFVGGSLSPLYVGEYSIQDSARLVIKYDSYENFSADLKYSKLSKEINLSLRSGIFLIVAGIENIKKSYLSDVSTNNFSVKLGMKY